MLFSEVKGGEEGAFRGMDALFPLERFTFEKGETQGGGTAPPGQKRAENPRFFRETTGRMVGNAQRFKLTLL